MIKSCSYGLLLLLLLCTLVTSSDVDFQTLKMLRKRCTTSCHRRSKWTSPITYYSNHTATFRLLISGDIESNPGPPAQRCQQCDKPVRRNQKQHSCTTCFNVSHTKCVTKTLLPGLHHTWVCYNCIGRVLPFFNIRELPVHHHDFLLENNEAVTDKHLNLLNEHNNKVSISHLNTQSITSSFPQFEAMLNRYKFDIMTLSETWLKDNIQLLNHVSIPGYNVEFSNRKDRRGGGVGFYVKESLTYKVRKDLQRIDTTLEHLWLEFKGRNKNNSYLVGVMYQPSPRTGDKDIWLGKLDHLLSQISTKWNGSIIIAGDTNINTLIRSPTVDRYADILKTHGMLQHISKPTRQGRKTIDHIITNLNNVQFKDVLPCDEISDHDAPYILADIKKPKFEPRHKYMRIEKNFNKDAFVYDVNMLPLNLVYSLDTPAEKLDIFNHLLTSCLDAHAPLKKCKITRPPAPWLKNLHVDQLLQERNKARSTAHETATNEDWKTFRDIRNKVKKTIKKEKADFYRKALSSKRPKEVWNIINKIIKPNHSKIDADPNELNNHFNTTAKRLLNCNAKSESFLKTLIDELPTQENEFQLQQVTYREVYTSIKSLRDDCSAGHDGLPAKYVKMVADSIASPLCHIINSCIEHNIFPEQWKVSRISPIPKIPLPRELSDYRPISILPVLSKVFERLILTQMVGFIEQHHLLSKHQSGFRKGHSTITVALKLRDDIVKAMHRGEITLSVMADYSKAFDTVDYETLLNKLHSFRFSRDALLLLMSYLSNRKQYVRVHVNSSDLLQVTNGVPQGSILGPMLFNIYVSDMCRQTNGSCLQYADDTSLYHHAKPKDLVACAGVVNEDVRKLVNWSRSTNLIFNSAKTKSILFSTKQMSITHKLHRENIFLINSTTENIERVKSLKILGITFTEHLAWNAHVNKSAETAYFSLRSLNLLKRYTPYNIRKNLVEALVLSRIDYGNAIFSNIPAYLIKQLQRVQNAAAAFVLRRYTQETDVLKLMWLPVSERIQFSLAKLAYKAVTDDTWPEYLPMERNEQPRRALRSNIVTDETTLKCLTNVHSTFESVASSIFNDLPRKCRTAATYQDFCRTSKKYFIDKATARICSSM